MIQKHYRHFLLFNIFTISFYTLIAETQKKNYKHVPLKSFNMRSPEEQETVLAKVYEKFTNRFEQREKITHLIPKWLVRDVLKNAPKLVKGICKYLSSSINNGTIPSFHRLLLVGAPGTGKTTMAYAIASLLKCSVIYLPASSLFGQYRNQTAFNITQRFNEMIKENKKQVIIIDELHKLFEHHANTQTDDSQTAAAFWLFLDTIEKKHPNVIIIGTANNVEKLPPEIKSRFHGKIITIPLPTKQQRLQALKKSIHNDPSLTLDASVTDAFIQKLNNKLNNSSLRDIQLLIDTAKMFKYAEDNAEENIENCSITLNRKHFEQALDQLKNESLVLEESWLQKIEKKISQLNNPLSFVINLGMLTNMSYGLATGKSLFIKEY